MFYGCLGSSFGYVIGVEYFGWKNSPIKVLSLGMLVGLGAIKKSDVTVLVRRMFGIHDERDERHHPPVNDDRSSKVQNP